MVNVRLDHYLPSLASMRSKVPMTLADIKGNNGPRDWGAKFPELERNIAPDQVEGVVRKIQRGYRGEKEVHGAVVRLLDSLQLQSQNLVAGVIRLYTISNSNVCQTMPGHFCPEAWRPFYGYVNDLVPGRTLPNVTSIECENTCLNDPTCFATSWMDYDQKTDVAYGNCYVKTSSWEGNYTLSEEKTQKGTHKWISTMCWNM